MAHPIKTYVRPLRRRSGLTQKELAFLLGAKSGTIVSRIEGVKRAPNVSAMLAYVFVFGAAPAELFPGLLSQIHEDVRGRVNELYEAIQGNPAKTTRTKLDFLETVQARLEGTGKAHDV